jgi:hypothetical protein
VESSTPRRVLIVAYRTAATPALLEAVRDRAARAPVRFTLLVPRPYWDPDTEQAALTLELALPLLDQAADDRVEGLVGDPDPLVAIQDALAREPVRRGHRLHAAGPRLALGVEDAGVIARTEAGATVGTCPKRCFGTSPEARKVAPEPASASAVSKLAVGWVACDQAEPPVATAPDNSRM